MLLFQLQFLSAYKQSRLQSIRYTDLLTQNLLEPVDYTQVDINLQKMREEAYSYIERFLNE